MIRVIRGEQYLTELLSDRLLIRHNTNIRRAFFNYGRDIVGELKRVVTTGTRTGRTYMFRGRQHRASAPGEPPANRTGKLANSFNYRARPRELRVGAEAFYAKWLDKGTKKMAARPYFSITNRRNSYKLERDLNDIQS